MPNAHFCRSRPAAPRRDRRWNAVREPVSERGRRAPRHVAREVPPLLWQPTPELIESSGMTAYTRWLDAERGLSFASYHDLWAWSVADIDAFWGRSGTTSGSRRPSPMLACSASGRCPAPVVPRSGALLCRAHLPSSRPGRRRRDPRVGVASAGRDEAGGQLAQLTAGIATGLRRLGVGRVTGSPPTCRTSPR